MARNFNRGVPGLLGYIDQKSDGRNPTYLNESTQAVLQLDPWLRANAEFYAGASINANDGNVLSGDVVPLGESWLLFDISVGVNLGTIAQQNAGDYAAVQLTQWNASAALVIPIAPRDVFMFTGTADTPNFAAAVSFRQEPLILRPGEFLGGVCEFSVRVGTTMGAYWRYRRLRFAA